MLIVGLTGNIAAGKSVVATRFVAHGATLVDADQLARQAVAKGTPALAAIVERWGTGVLTGDGALDRVVLRRIIFADRAERAALDAIVHPEVARLRDEAVAAARAAGARVVVCDIPLLFEVGIEDSVDKIVLVDAPEALRRERLMQDRRLSPAEADAMIAAQMPSERKRARADFVIDNVGTREELERRADEVWAALDPRNQPG